MAPNYKIEVLDRDLQPITSLNVFVATDQMGNYLEYGSRLSSYGEAKFRILTKDIAWDRFGNIFDPYQNHIRIYRANQLVWSGVVVDLPQRNKRYIEIKGRTYLHILEKVLVKHDAPDGNNAEYFRTFKSGTMADAVRAIMTESITDTAAYPIISKITIGTIINPKYPQGFVDTANVSIAGQDWKFTPDIALKFDERDIFFVLSQLANYSQCDFEITQDLVFNFIPRIGSRKVDMVFDYGVGGAIDDYNAPLWGSRMANHLVGIAADKDYVILKTEASDSASIAKRGRLSGVAAYIDVKNKNALNTRLAEELRFVSEPDAELSMIMNDKAAPLGTYNLGDTVTAVIEDGPISVRQERRVIGYDVKVNETMDETVRIMTNKPRVGE